MRHDCTIQPKLHTPAGWVRVAACSCGWVATVRADQDVTEEVTTHLGASDQLLLQYAYHAPTSRLSDDYWGAVVWGGVVVFWVIVSAVVIQWVVR